MLADELRRAIRESGLSFNALATDTGVDKTIVGRFMAQKRTMTVETAGKLAKALGLRLVKK